MKRVLTLFAAALCISASAATAQVPSTGSARPASAAFTADTRQKLIASLKTGSSDAR